MRTRRLLELCLAAGIGAAAALVASPARADDDGHRFGLVAALGGGLAGVVHPGALPGFVGFTDLGVEIMGEIRPWGLFLRGDFLSSGNDGRWTAYAVGAGTQYRLFGNTHKLALFLRGGLTYERWIGNNQGCPVTFVIPNSCVDEIAPTDPNMPSTPPFSTTADMLGLLAGVRLEFPISFLYLAVGATFVPTVSVDASYPASTFQLRFDVTAGLRDTRKNREAPRTEQEIYRKKL
jgi:hypothetical protein